MRTTTDTRSSKLVDKLLRRPHEASPCTPQSHRGLKYTDDGLQHLRKSPRLFCSYLTLNARGWKRLKTHHYVSSSSSKQKDTGGKLARVLSQRRRTTDTDEFEGFDELDNPPDSRGFEVVWLADQDDISTAVKEWVSDGDRSNQKSVCIQGTQTGAKPSTPLAVWTVAVTNDHQYLACGSNGGLIFVWQLNEGPQLEEELEQEAGAEELEKSPVEKRSMLRRVATLSGHTGGVMRLQWSTSTPHRILLSSGFDSTVRLWSVLPSPATLCILKCPTLPVGVCFAKPDTAVVTCLDGATRLISFNPPPSQAIPEPDADTPPLINCKVDVSFAGKDAATHVSISPCGNVLAVGSQYGVVTLSDISTGQVIREVHCRNHFGRHKSGEKITGISWNSNSRYIAVTSRDGRIRVIDTQDPSRRLKLKAHSDPRLVAIFDPSDRFVLAAAENGHIYVWDLMKACQEKVHRRRRFYLAQTFSKKALSETEVVGGDGLEIAPLKDEFKRETAHPVASFAGHKGIPTAMCMMPFENSSIPAARVILGTECGSVEVYIILLSK